jgi:effector-binding domain-containing protein
MADDFEILEVTPRPVLSIRVRTTFEGIPQNLGESYTAIGQYLGELGEPMVGAPYAAFYNMDMKDLDIEIGMQVSRELPGRGTIQAGHIPGGKAASAIHIGPYSKMEPTYEALAKWMAENGLDPTGVAYEFYIDDPAEISQKEIRTQIYFPLKAA